jgi:hypothetical protein
MNLSDQPAAQASGVESRHATGEKWASGPNKEAGMDAMVACNQFSPQQESRPALPVAADLPRSVIVDINYA